MEGPRTTRLWDLPALPSFATVPQPLRVVWAEEQTRRRRIFGGIVGETVEGKRWIWVTDLSAAAVGAEKIQRWGRERWDLETRGFNELATLWYKDHRLIHHPPGDRSLLLALAAAFLLTYLFYARNLKPVARSHLTRLAFAARLRDDFSLASSSVWPAALRSDSPSRSASRLLARAGGHVP